MSKVDLHSQQIKLPFLTQFSVRAIPSRWQIWRDAWDKRRRSWQRLPIEEQQRREVRLWMWGAGGLLTLMTALSVVEARQSRHEENFKIPEGLRMVRINLIGPDHEAALEWPDDVNRVDLYSSQHSRAILRGVDLWRSPRGSFSVLVPESLLQESGLPRDLQLPVRAIRRGEYENRELPAAPESNAEAEAIRLRSNSSALHRERSSGTSKSRRRTSTVVIHTELGLDPDPDATAREEWRGTNPNDAKEDLSESSPLTVDDGEMLNMSSPSMTTEDSQTMTDRPPLQHLEDD